MQLDTQWGIVFLTSYTSDICMGLIGTTCFKGTPGVLKHYSGLPMANPGGPLKITHARYVTIIMVICLTFCMQPLQWVESVKLDGKSWCKR